MSPGMPKVIADKYCLRFGRLAVDMGFITEAQLTEASRFQYGELGAPKAGELLPTVLFDHGWMTSEQIDQVLNALLKNSRIEQASQNDTQENKTGSES